MIETGPCIKKLTLPVLNNLIRAICALIEDKQFLNIVVLGGWTKDVTRYLIKSFRSLDKKVVKSFIVVL